MSKQIKITVGKWETTITPAQLWEVLNCSGNGYADGDFYGVNDPDGGKGRDGLGGWTKANVYERGYNKLKAALDEADPIDKVKK